MSTRASGCTRTSSSFVVGDGMISSVWLGSSMDASARSILPTIPLRPQPSLIAKTEASRQEPAGFSEKLQNCARQIRAARDSPVDMKRSGSAAAALNFLRRRVDTNNANSHRSGPPRFTYGTRFVTCTTVEENEDANCNNPTFAKPVGTNHGRTSRKSFTE